MKLTIEFKNNFFQQHIWPQLATKNDDLLILYSILQMFSTFQFFAKFSSLGVKCVFEIFDYLMNLDQIGVTISV